MPALFDFSQDVKPIIIGDDFAHDFVFQDAHSDPLPLTGEFYAQVRKAGVLLLEFTCTITGDNTNIVHLEASSAQTAALAPVCDAHWDLEHHDPKVSTIISGTADIVRGVTEASP